MSKHYDDVMTYCEDIMSHKILSGQYTEKAVQRFLSDQKKTNFEYVLINDKADDEINFAESMIIPTFEKEDKHLQLLPWMKFQHYNIWGWYHKKNDEKRRFRNGYCELARKNSKTTSFLYPWISYDFLTTKGSRSFFVLGDGKQATEVYEELVSIFNEDEELSAEIECLSSAIYCERNLSKILFFTSESASTDSYKNSLSIIDEYHEYTSSKILTAFKYGGRAKLNNLVYIITTAGTNLNGPCYSENKKCKAILDGKIKNEEYFGIIYAYDEHDNWQDPKNFIKANPSLYEIIPEANLISDLNDAIHDPKLQPQFKSKTCGIWTNSNTSWIPIQKWQKNLGQNIDPLELINKDCYGSFDLSNISDFTAYTLYFKLDSGQYYAQHRFYIPEATLQERYERENVNILSWVDQKIITVIEGETIDYEILYQDILEDSTRYNIKIIAYDTWQSNFLVNKINDEIPQIITTPYSQSLKSIGSATKQFEKAILDGEIIDNNPVLEWMIGNVTVKVDINGNYKPLKENKSSSNRIDGVVTSIMALDMLISNTTNKPTEEDSYEISWI